MAGSDTNFDPPPTPGPEFPVLDTVAPFVVTFSPADELGNVALASNVIVTFSESIARGTGNIVLKTSTGATVATYDAATSSNLSLSGNTLIVNPTADFTFATSYKLEFVAGSVKDLAGNAYAGTSSYNFSTVAASDNKIVNGTAENDRLNSTDASETMDGGAGIDTVIYAGNRSSYTLTPSGNDFLLAGVSASQGTDTLVNVERIEFADKKLALDLDASEHGGQALEFIGLVAPSLIHTPSVVTLIMDLFDRGQTMLQVCELALQVGLVTSIAGNNSNEALAAMVFRNFFDREADAGTIDVLVILN